MVSLMNVSSTREMSCYNSGLDILFFFGGSKLLLPGARPGSKTNFVVAKLYVHFLRNENIILILSIVFPQQSCRGRIRLYS